eukprot:scaffold2752_cov393-Prasinococcus_capsulatus_cf.AAC.30
MRRCEQRTSGRRRAQAGHPKRLCSPWSLVGSRQQFAVAIRAKRKQRDVTAPATVSSKELDARKRAKGLRSRLHGWAREMRALGAHRGVERQQHATEGAPPSARSPFLALVQTVRSVPLGLSFQARHSNVVAHDLLE